MTKITTAAIGAAPTAIVAGLLASEILANLRVVDAGTGDTIDRVLEADAEAGTVRRFAVEDGNLVREEDRYKLIDEKRDIRIEWIEDPAPVPPADVTLPVAEVQG